MLYSTKDKTEEWGGGLVDWWTCDPVALVADLDAVRLSWSLAGASSIAYSPIDTTQSMTDWAITVR